MVLKATEVHELLDRETRSGSIVVDGGAGTLSNSGSLLRCRVVGGWWLVDLRRRRLCRCAEPLDPTVIADRYWERFRRVAVSAEWAVAELVDGLFLRATVAGPVAATA